MFDHEALDDLDRVAASDALAEVRRRVLAVEAEQLYLAAHWADLHAPEFVSDCLDLLPGSPAPGAEGTKQLGGDGCPEMSEFAGVELAALLGRTTGSGEELLVDAVTLRHRHPGLWRGIREGRVRVWLAIRAGRLCTSAQLTQEQAHWVDDRTTPYVETLPPGRYLALVRATIIAADPAAAEERARAAELARFVRAGQTDEHGLRTLVARARAGDVTVLVAVIDRIAAILSDRGDTDPVEVRRATALRVLANPAEALHLLTSAALDHLDPAAETGDATEPADETVSETGSVDLVAERRAAAAGERSDGRFVGHPEEWIGWMRDSSGDFLPHACTRRDLQDTDLRAPRGCGTSRWPDDLPLELDLHPAPGLAPSRPPDPPDPAAAAERQDPPVPPGRDGESDPASGLGGVDLLRAVVVNAERAASRLTPTCVLHVHASTESVTTGAGVVRVEEIGPMVGEQARSWLTGEHGGTSPGVGRMRIRVQPVLDPDRVAPVDRYEVPATMRQAVEELQPYSPFPYATTASRRCDQDHVVPYRPQGPAGQTRVESLQPLGRRHHRVKTFGSWQVVGAERGAYWWRTPTGHWFHVGPAGTRPIGRDRDFDSALGVA
ncbi:hypothetical protein G7072_04200 [Nocardioides sp. HDW12B]|uniref:hypothetical protein n=1 Tax=Nocardioides sp. HDW12B TaxID=2714939 RepID=UPI00140776BA|nr:hypothetical protein [Nocardioides sp. HDW12B]QIK65644.1 hypothetical protein G7072_04200 [Nocardioides sp. HDW12B]